MKRVLLVLVLFVLAAAPRAYAAYLSDFLAYPSHSDLNRTLNCSGNGCPSGTTYGQAFSVSEDDTAVYPYGDPTYGLTYEGPATYRYEETWSGAGGSGDCIYTWDFTASGGKLNYSNNACPHTNNQAASATYNPPVPTSVLPTFGMPRTVSGTESGSLSGQYTSTSYSQTFHTAWALAGDPAWTSGLHYVSVSVNGSTANNYSIKNNLPSWYDGNPVAAVSDKSIPCTSFTLGGRAVGTDCFATVEMDGPTAVDITPKTSTSGLINAEIAVGCIVNMSRVLPGSLGIAIDPTFSIELPNEPKNAAKFPLSPAYDLVMYAVPDFVCANGADVNSMQLPNVILATGKILYGQNDNEAFSGVFTRTTMKDPVSGGPIYEISIPGIISGGKYSNVDEFVKAIAGGQPIKIAVDEKKEDGSGTERVSQPVVFSACAPIWKGSQSRYSVIGMRDDLTSANIFSKRFTDGIRGGFSKKEPYASYLGNFSFTADLFPRPNAIPISDLLIAASDYKSQTGKLISLSEQEKLLAGVIGTSSCGSGLYMKYVEGFVGGVSMFPIGSTSIRGALVDSDDPEVAVHEFSHLFAGLNDEYLYQKNGPINYTPTLPFTQCSFNPRSDYLYSANIYGGTNFSGCSFTGIQTGPKQTDLMTLYRPSNDSMMNMPSASNGFNVVSCGYILAAINGGSGKSHFPECVNMKGIVLSGDPFSLISETYTDALKNAGKEIYDSLDGIFGKLFTAKKAQAQTDSGNGIILIVENFSPSSGIAMDPAMPVATTTATSTEPFSFDFKINGQTKPLTVPPNAPISLEWTVTGASYCVSSWSGIIAFSGTDSIVPASTDYTIECAPAGGGPSLASSIKVAVSQVMAPEAASGANSNGQSGGGIANPLSDSVTVAVLKASLNTFVQFLFPLVILAFVISGMLFAVARGNAVRLVFAKRFFKWTLIAAAVFLGFWIILQTIGSTASQVIGQ